MRPEFRYSDFIAKDFGKVDIHAFGEGSGPWVTPENIPVKNMYEKEDLENMEHLDYAAGIPPFLRGPYSSHVCDESLDHPAICRFFDC